MTLEAVTMHCKETSHTKKAPEGAFNDTGLELAFAQVASGPWQGLRRG